MEQEEEKLSLRLLIWARAARRNQWNVEKNPEQEVQETLFFKLMDLVYFMGKLYINKILIILIKNINLLVCCVGGKVEEFLPSVDVLLKEPELEELAASSNFQFLIKLIYEYAYRNY